MTVRRVINRGGAIIGMFPSLKMQRPVRYESSIERDLCYLLEFDPQVHRYHEQPFTITHTTRDGDTHQYPPDFQVYRTTGLHDLVECKPDALRNDPHTRQQIEIGPAWSDANNHIFCLVTDRELRQGHTLDNIKMLWRYARMRVDPHVLSRTHDYLWHNAGATIAQTAAYALQTSEQPHHGPYLYALVFQHVLNTVLTAPLSWNSGLWVSLPDQQKG